MNSQPATRHLDTMTSSIRSMIMVEAPDLLGLFDEYAGEMKFGRALLESNLETLDRGSSILELGAGSLLLSCQLQYEGFNVTALEPIGSGFSHFSRLQAIVLRHAVQHNFAPKLLRIAGEGLSIENSFHFAFSINVMEHVADFGTVLQRVNLALKRGGTYRFVCPNYTFPYEPHFNLPTLINRALTKKLLWRWIEHSTNVVDPIGTWASLNWISVARVDHFCKSTMQVTPYFDKEIFQVFLERVFTSHRFQERRGPFLSKVAGLLHRTGLVSLTKYIPACLLPVMDCSIIRR